MHPLLDNEALRIMRRLPQIEPLQPDGKKVMGYYQIPLKFSIMSF
jgi:outer membrane biosynthesis protein TonB